MYSSVPAAVQKDALSYFAEFFSLFGGLQTHCIYTYESDIDLYLKRR